MNTVIIIIAIVAGLLLIRTVRINAQNAKAKAFEQANSAFALMHVKIKYGANTKALMVHAVNGQPPVLKNDGASGAIFYLQPGKNVLKVHYSSTGMGKNIYSDSTGKEIEIFAEAHKHYTLNFDEKNFTYTFEEMA